MSKNFLTQPNDFLTRQLIRGGAWEILNQEKDGAGLEALQELLAVTLVAACQEDRERARELVK